MKNVIGVFNEHQPVVYVVFAIIASQRLGGNAQVSQPKFRQPLSSYNALSIRGDITVTCLNTSRTFSPPKTALRTQFVDRFATELECFVVDSISRVSNISTRFHRDGPTIAEDAERGGVFFAVYISTCLNTESGCLTLLRPGLSPSLVEQRRGRFSVSRYPVFRHCVTRWRAFRCSLTAQNEFRSLPWDTVTRLYRARHERLTRRF